MKEPLIGQLLVASSVTPSPLYAGGVCLVVHEDDEHTIGVMLNRPMKPNPEAIDALLMHVLDSGTSDDGQLLDGADADEPGDASFGDAALGDSWDATVDSSIESDDSASWSEDMFGDPEQSASPHHGGTNRLADLNLENASDGLASGQDLADDSSLVSAPGAQSPRPPSQPLLHFGGPVSGPVVALHQNAQLAEMQSADGVYVAADREHLEHLLTDRQHPFRLILGHLRWDNEQLDREMDAGWWHRVPASAETVFSPAPAMWPRLIRRGTANSLASWIGVPDLVAAAQWN